MNTKITLTNPTDLDLNIAVHQRVGEHGRAAPVGHDLGGSTITDRRFAGGCGHYLVVVRAFDKGHLVEAGQVQHGRCESVSPNPLFQRPIAYKPQPIMES